MSASPIFRVLGLLAALGITGLVPAGVSAGGPRQVSPPANPAPASPTPAPGSRKPDPGRSEPGRSSDRLVLAVVRNDGILLPFAALNGRKWSAPWPSLQRRSGPNSIELPVNLASVPLDWWGGERPADWRLWPRNSESSRSLT